MIYVLGTLAVIVWTVAGYGIACEIPDHWRPREQRVFLDSDTDLAESA